MIDNLINIINQVENIIPNILVPDNLYQHEHEYAHAHEHEHEYEYEHEHDDEHSHAHDDEHSHEHDDEHSHTHEHDVDEDEHDHVHEDEHEPILRFVSNVELENQIEDKYTEIMNWTYENMTNINDEIIKFIDVCYLKNLQYDDEPIDTIRYTIRTVFEEGLQYEIQNLASGIFGYSMVGINYVFNENFEILNEILKSEIKRLIRRSYSFQIFRQLILGSGGVGGNGLGFQPMEDIKLVVTKEELDKIPKKVYKDIDLDTRNKHDKCPICQEEYRENDTVRILPCEHIFHNDCVDNWLLEHSHKCPCCRQTSANYIPKI